MSVYTLSGNCNFETEAFDYNSDDPSLNGAGEHSCKVSYNMDKKAFNDLFFREYDIEYITHYFDQKQIPLRVVTHPRKTITCYEKAHLLDSSDPLNVIKALYFENPRDKSLFAIVIPETGCFVDRKHLAGELDMDQEFPLAKAKELPKNMSYGTCSPFITEKDLVENGGAVRAIIFDTETLIAKKTESTLDDFSFGLDHRFSVQMNYYHCFQMLKKKFSELVFYREILRLSFKEKMVRKKGHISIDYKFSSLNYRTAKFINSIHGYGDVSIVNDFSNELDLPDVLTTVPFASGKNNSM